MPATQLHLLTRDGAVYLEFRPRLTAAQYVELDAASERASTRNDLYEEALSLADEWAVAVHFDE